MIYYLLIVNPCYLISLKEFLSSINCMTFQGMLPFTCRNYLTPLIHKHSIKRNDKIRSRIYALFGDMADDSTGKNSSIHLLDCLIIQTVIILLVL